MRSCQSWDLWISRYVDRDLAGDERSALLAHVAKCARCRERLRKERNASESLRGALGAPEGSLFDLETRIVSSTAPLVAESTTSAPPRSRSPFVAAVAAAVFALAGVSAIAFFYGDPGGQNIVDRSAPSGPKTPLEAFLESDSSPRVVELRRDSHGVESVPLRNADKALHVGFTSEDNSQLGIETLRRRRVIVEPTYLNSGVGTRSSRPRSRQPSVSAGQGPSWSIELERVDTRLVRFANDPWY